MPAVIFDLDDTLYPEREFTASGFRTVAEELQRRGVGLAEEIAAYLWQTHSQQGRDHVFDKAAEHYGFPQTWVPELVRVFRTHRPQITLPLLSRETLQRLRNEYRLGIVTDGFAHVQRNKLAALGVGELVDCIVVADDFGRAYWKPSPVPFHACCRSLGVQPQNAVVVGDNPERDICGARNAGLRAIRIRSVDGYFSNVESETAAKPDLEISSLLALEDALGVVLRRLSRAG